MTEAAATGLEAITAASALLNAVEHLKWTVEVCRGASQQCARVAIMADQANGIPRADYAKFNRNIKLAVDIVDGDAQMGLTRALALWNDAIDYVMECVGALPSRINDWEGEQRVTMESDCLDIARSAEQAARQARVLWLTPPVADWRKPGFEEMVAYSDLIARLNNCESVVGSGIREMQELQESVH